MKPSNKELLCHAEWAIAAGIRQAPEASIAGAATTRRANLSLPVFLYIAVSQSSSHNVSYHAGQERKRRQRPDSSLATSDGIPEGRWETRS